jgi:hypothetical protein
VGAARPQPSTAARLTAAAIVWLRCPRCGQPIRRPFLHSAAAFPAVEIHRYRGAHDVCRLLLRYHPVRPTVTVIPAWEREEQALLRAGREP